MQKRIPAFIRCALPVAIAATIGCPDRPVAPKDNNNYFALINPSSASLKVHDVITMTAALGDLSGAQPKALSFGQTATWSVDDDKVVRILDFDPAKGTARLEGVGSGSTTVRILVSLVVNNERMTLPGSAIVSVGADPPASLKIIPSSLEMAVGETAEISCSALNGSGQTIAGTTVAWQSGTLGVATITPTGTVSAQNDGQSVLTCSLPGTALTATAVVTVHPFSVQVVTDRGGPPTVGVGQVLDLRAVVTDFRGATLNLGTAGRSITWKSEAPALATIAVSGASPAGGTLASVTGVSAGTPAKMTGTLGGPGGRAASIDVTVIAVPTITVTNSTNRSMPVTTSIQITYEIRDATGALVTNVTPTYSWGGFGTGLFVLAQQPSAVVVRGDVAGSYVFTLRAVVNGLTATAAVNITVTP